MSEENNKTHECWSVDEENFNCSSLDELILSHDDLVVGGTAWKADAVEIDPASYISASDVTEMLSERAYDDVGEYAEDWPCVTGEATAELDALLRDWVHKHCKEGMTFYRVRNSTAYTLTAEDLA